MADHWHVHAVKYAERNSRTRADSFLFDDHPAAAHGMDYYVWVLQKGPEIILVDTGYDAAEAKRRNRPILLEPGAALAPLGLTPDDITTVIITHLHYDHAGGMDQFPNAIFHLQEAEMSFATGACMCEPVLQMPFTADHVCTMVRHIYAGRVVFHNGSGQVAPGVRVHRTGGHSRGLQVVEIETKTGPLVLASDAAHYWENVLMRKPFPIVVDVEDMLSGFDTLLRLAAGDPSRVIPGHDPLTRAHFARSGQADHIFRLDPGPIKPLPKLL